MQREAKPDHNPQSSAKVFHALSVSGKRLGDMHVNYNKEASLDWRVEAMKLSRDKASLFYNDFLTLNGIPQETYDYRLGNRSALEWVVNQYRVARDEKGSIVSDPNRLDDEQYIVRLVAQVISVSLETMRIVKALPPLNEKPVTA